MPAIDASALTAITAKLNAISRALCLLYAETDSESASEAYSFLPCAYSFAKAGPSGLAVISLQKEDSLLVILIVMDS
jgi:hypothetical protein